MKHITTAMKAACAAALVCVGALGPARAQLAPPPRLLPQVTPKSAPTMAPVPAPTPSRSPTSTPPGWCEEDCLVGPTKPLRFELLAGERESSGFAVTAPGAIKVQVQATGVPLVLSLRRPDGRIVERQGSGTIVIDDAATAADIAKGVLWGVGLRTAQEAPRAPQGAVTMRTAVRAVAGGTLSVQHPAADAARVQAALKQAASQAQQKSASPPAPAAPAIDAKALALQAQSNHDKQVAQTHAAALSKLQTTLPPAVVSQINQRIVLRLQGQTLQQAITAAPVRLIKADAIARPATLSVGGAQRAVSTAGLLTPKAGTGTASMKGAATGGAAAVGSGGGAAVAAPAPSPVLAATNTGEGDPGTPVTLSGSDFGDAPGEVHFIVGNAKDVAATITYWSGTQVVTEVPYADGVPVYDGHVYVKRGDGAKTALRPFRFLPLYDVATLPLPTRTHYELGLVSFDSLPANMEARGGNVGKPSRCCFAGPFGGSGYDEFYVSSRLKNGWVTSSVAIPTPSVSGAFGQGAGNAYVVDVRAGTDSPYVKVRWWYDGFTHVIYGLQVTVKRPKNLPCAANPCPVL